MNEKLLEDGWKPGTVVHNYNPSTQEAEAGASLSYLSGSDFKI